jgi:hypothetical protein
MNKKIYNGKLYYIDQWVNMETNNWRIVKYERGGGINDIGKVSYVVIVIM